MPLSSDYCIYADAIAMEKMETKVGSLQNTIGRPRDLPYFTLALAVLLNSNAILKCYMKLKRLHVS